MSVMKEWDIWEADVPYVDDPTKSSVRPYEYEIYK